MGFSFVGWVACVVASCWAIGWGLGVHYLMALFGRERGGIIFATVILILGGFGLYECLVHSPIKVSVVGG